MAAASTNDAAEFRNAGDLPWNSVDKLTAWAEKVVADNRSMLEAEGDGGYFIIADTVAHDEKQTTASVQYAAGFLHGTLLKYGFEVGDVSVERFDKETHFIIL